MKDILSHITVIAGEVQSETTQSVPNNISLEQTWLLRRLLNFVGEEELDSSQNYGLALVLLLLVFQLSKALTMAAMWTISTYTGEKTFR